MGVRFPSLFLRFPSSSKRIVASDFSRDRAAGMWRFWYCSWWWSGGFVAGGSYLTATVLPGRCLKWTPDAEDFSLGVQSENRGTASCSRDTRKETQISALDLKS